jgi:uncharacterized membrane protein
MNIEIVGYILLVIIALWFIIDIIVPLICRATIALIRWYVQRVING